MSKNFDSPIEVGFCGAAGSLPAQPEQEWMPCLNVGCGKELNHDGDCDYEHVAPVEAKGKERCEHGVWLADHCYKCAEPKPTPSEPMHNEFIHADDAKGWKQGMLAASLLIEIDPNKQSAAVSSALIAAQQKIRICAQSMSQPDSSSIPTKREQYLVHLLREAMPYLQCDSGCDCDGDRLWRTISASLDTDSSSIPEIELELRRMMWLGHGHTGMYGDDGEMQCMECQPYGVVDYKREPLDKVRETFRAVQMERMMKPRDSSSISTEQTFEEWWTALFVSYAVEKLDDPYDFAKAAWNAAKGLK